MANKKTQESQESPPEPTQETPASTSHGPALNAALVRSPMSRRSSWAKTAVMLAIASPAAVEKSTPRSRATRFHPSRLARSMVEAASMTLRLSRSSLATMIPAASPRWMA